MVMNKELLYERLARLGRISLHLAIIIGLLLIGVLLALAFSMLPTPANLR